LLARVGGFVQRVEPSYAGTMFEQETAGLVVRVEPRFLPEQSAPDRNRYVWAYTIEIENRGAEPVQLISRFWQIIDENGLTQEVRGPGVVGEQPVIPPGEHFRYTSACPLGAPSGVMVGAYSMQRVGDGSAFDIAVPAFALDSPHHVRRAN
jgi:ApaG protein